MWHPNPHWRSWNVVTDLVILVNRLKIVLRIVLNFHVRPMLIVIPSARAAAALVRLVIGMRIVTAEPVQTPTPVRKMPLSVRVSWHRAMTTIWTGLRNCDFSE